MNRKDHDQHHSPLADAFYKLLVVYEAIAIFIARFHHLLDGRSIELKISFFVFDFVPVSNYASSARSTLPSWSRSSNLKAALKFSSFKRREFSRQQLMN